MYFVPHPLSAEILVSAAVRVVFPWSTCPIVPTFTCGLFRSNFAFAIAAFPVKWRPNEVRSVGTTSAPRLRATSNLHALHTTSDLPNHQWCYLTLEMISSALLFGTSS